MHRSYISYTLSRPYPYRWLTPVAIIVGLAFIAFFSVINFASSGYILESIYSTNPNATTSHTWFGDWPSLLESKVRATCQPANIPVNTKFYTNNSALQYTLTSVRDAGDNSLPSMIYYNNQLEDCNVSSIQLQLDQIGARTATQFALSMWGIDAQAQVSCRVPQQSNANGAVTLNLTADYNFVPDTVSIDVGTLKFPGRSATSAASLYWGESLLSMYYVQTMLAMMNATTLAEGDSTYYGMIKALVSFTHSGNTSDITSLDYFAPRFRGVSPNSDLFSFAWIYIPNDPKFSILDSQQQYPYIWIPADSMAKSFESTILTDLGQQSAQPNILKHADLLQHFTANFSQVVDYARSTYVPLVTLDGILDVGPAIKDYNTLKDTTGRLGVNASTIAVDYLCSVPHRKPTGDLLISIITSDLVFSHAAWVVFTFGVCFFMRRRDQNADYCEGCLERRGAGDQIALLQATPKSGGSYELLDRQQRSPEAT